MEVISEDQIILIAINIYFQKLVRLSRQMWVLTPELITVVFDSLSTDGPLSLFPDV